MLHEHCKKKVIQLLPFSPQVADMLRILSLTKDPAFLTKFLQDEILPE